MKATPSEIQKFLAVLAETPRRLAAASAHADESRLRLKPDPRGWSAVDILAHLRSCADVWGASIESMLAEEEPGLSDLHLRQWIKQTDYPDLSFVESLQSFSHQREKLLQILKSLLFEHWERGAWIGGRRHTVFTQVRRLAKHETEHCVQVEKLLLA